jgi:hypothetical protein
MFARAKHPFKKNTYPPPDYRQKGKVFENTSALLHNRVPILLAKRKKMW